MPRLAISAPGLQPNPIVVMKLLRVLGTKVRLIAAALSQDAPLLDEELPDNPSAKQLAKLRQLLDELAVAAVRPLILVDGREIEQQALHQIMEASERMAARPGLEDAGPEAA